VITASALELRAGARILLSDVNARVQPGDRIGLVGRNGAGKTTTLRVLAGEAQPFGGTVSRRGEIPQAICFETAGLSLNTATREVTRAGRQILLTPREYSLLELLMRHKGRVLPRSTIVEAIWGFDTEIEENTLDAFIRLLRNKIEIVGAPRLVRTVRGIGYSLTEHEP